MKRQHYWVLLALSMVSFKVFATSISAGLSSVPSETSSDYTLTWSIAYAVSPYRLQYSSNGHHWSDLETDLAATGATLDQHNMPMGHHSYRIALLDVLPLVNGAIPLIREVSEVFTVGVAPTVPNNLIVPIETTTLNQAIRWDPVLDSSGQQADTYILEQQVAGGGWVVVYTGSDSEWLPSDPNLSSEYQYRVRACVEGLCSVFSDAATVGEVIDPANTWANDATYYGSLRGSHSISNTGAFTYELVLEIPVGINGMQPDLTLSYESNRGNGVLGWGWQVSGMSSIIRCPASIFRDGYASSINTNDNFKFCLDGTRLVKVGAREYRTEQESFVRIQSYGGTEQHPNYWSITSNDGRVLTYGDNGTGTNANRAVINDDADQPMIWYLRRATDVANNYMDYQYHTNTATSEQLLHSIDYTKNDAAQSIYHQVVFEYESRADVTQAYRAGTSYRLAQRVTDITTYVNATGGVGSGERVSQYQFSYQTAADATYDDPVQASRLDRVTRCFVTDAECTEPLVFEWDTVTSTNSGEPLNTHAAIKYGDFNGDGLTDAITMLRNLHPDNAHPADCNLNLDVASEADIDYAINACPVAGIKGSTIYIVYGDEYIDNDTDMTAYTRRLSARLFDETTRDIAVNLDSEYMWDTSPEHITADQHLIDHTYQIIDIDGDGLLDIMMSGGAGNQADLFYLAQTDAEYAVNGGHRFVEAPGYALRNSHPQFVFQENALCGLPAETGTNYLDLNGDALLDRLTRSTVVPSGQTVPCPDDLDVVEKQLYAEINNGTGFDARINWGVISIPWAGKRYYEQSLDFYHGNSQSVSRTRHWSYGDFNGDGLQDIFALNAIFYNTGSGFTDAHNLFRHNLEKYYSGPDGGGAHWKLVGTSFIPDTLSVAYADGNGNFEPRYSVEDAFGNSGNGVYVDYMITPYAVNQHQAFYSDAVVLDRTIGDFNGDGLTDIAADGKRGLTVWLSTGTGFTAPQLWNPNATLRTYFSNGADASGSPISVVDVNKDGKDDIVNMFSLEVSFSTGEGFTDPQPVWGDPLLFGQRYWFDPEFTAYSLGMDPLQGPPSPVRVSQVFMWSWTRHAEWSQIDIMGDLHHRSPAQFFDIDADGLPEINDSARFSLVALRIAQYFGAAVNECAPEDVIALTCLHPFPSLTELRDNMEIDGLTRHNMDSYKPFTQGMPRPGVNRLGTSRLRVINEGHNKNLQIDYSPLGSRALYTPGKVGAAHGSSQSDNLLGRRVGIEQSSGHHGITYPTSVGNAVRGDSISGLRAGMIVVEQVTQNDGLGDPVSSTYSYEDAHTHRNGLGFLGFHAQTELTTKSDEHGVMQQIKTVRNYHLDIQDADDQPKYWLAGRVKKETVRVGSMAATEDCVGSELTDCFRLLSRTRNQWKVRQFGGTVEDGAAHPKPHYHAYIAESSTEQFDLSTADLSYSTRSSNQASSTAECDVLTDADIGLGTSPLPTLVAITDDDFTAEGCQLQTATTQCDATPSAHAMVFEQTVRPSFLSVNGRRCLPSTTQVTSQTGATDTVFDSITRRTDTFYNHLGQVDRELTGMNGTAQERLTTAYLYNSYGSVRQLDESWTSTTHDGLSFTSRRTSISETYDASGERTVVVTNPELQQSTTVYDRRFGTPISETDINDLVTTTTYDQMGRISTVDLPTGVVSETRYLSCDGCFAQHADAIAYQHTKTTGQAPTKAYVDHLGRAVGSETVALDGQRIYTTGYYDVYGRTVSQSDPFYAGETPRLTQFSYDLLDRLTMTTFSDGSTQHSVYERLSEERVNREGQFKTVLTNSAGWLLKSTDNNGLAVDFTYYPFGLLKTTQVGGQTSTRVNLQYDNLGRKTQLDDPNTGVINYSYNPLGLLATEQDAKGQATHYRYDMLGRQTHRIDDALAANPALRTHVWTYDLSPNGQGQLAALDGYDTEGSPYKETYTYTVFSQPETTGYDYNGNSHSVTQHYDVFSRPAGITYPGGYAIQHRYNAYGVMDQVLDATNTALWQLDSQNARGQITGFTLGNGVQTTQGYEPVDGRIQTVRAVTSNSLLVQDHRYTFSRLGNLSQREDLANGLYQTFCYDSMNRLKVTVNNAFCAASTAADTTYDSLGNIRSHVGTAGAYSYGANSAGPHAVTSVGSKQYFYDANGNIRLTQFGTEERTVTWSAFNKPTLIERKDNGTVVASTAIVYGPDKQRIQRTDSSGRTTRYVATGVYEETTHNGTTEHIHYIGDFALYVTKTGNETGSEMAYQHRDHLGSLVARTPETINTLVDVEFLANDAWGNREDGYWGATKPGVNFSPNYTARGYTDHEHLDSVGLIHMNGRVYDPEIGRFLSPDPLVQAPDNTQSYNRYTYVFNNPISFTDPTGYYCGADNCKTYVYTGHGLSQVAPQGNFTINNRDTVYNNNRGSITLAEGSFDSGSVAVAGGASNGVNMSSAGFNGQLSSTGQMNSMYSSQFAGQVIEEIEVEGWQLDYLTPAGPAPINVDAYISYWSGVPVWTSNITTNWVYGSRPSRVQGYNSELARINAPHVPGHFYPTYDYHSARDPWDTAAGQATKALGYLTSPFGVGYARAVLGAHRFWQAVNALSTFSTAVEVGEGVDAAINGGSPAEIIEAGVNVATELHGRTAGHPVNTVVGFGVNSVVGVITE